MEEELLDLNVFQINKTFIMFIIFSVLYILLLSIMLLVIHLFDRKIGAGKALLYGWGSLVLLCLVGKSISLLTAKTVLDKEDYYGEYIINRNYFPGEQADWQYNHFRFEILENDSIYFYETEEDKIIKTYSGKVYFTSDHKSKRLNIQMEQPSHHILSENPTTYRFAWSFYLTFDSPKFNTVFFKKGKWRKLEL